VPMNISPPITRPRARRAVATALAGSLVGILAVTGLAPGAMAATPDQEPGVTLRSFQLPPGLQDFCTLKSGTTPNADKLMATIDYSTEAQFGLSDNFLSIVTANLAIATQGDYTFRLTSDDGSKLTIDDALVVDHGGLHGATSKDGTATLTAGTHALRVDFLEAGYGQVLKLEWKRPGASAFEVVPSSVLSTEANVVRVTAPGTKYCEGATDTAGDGLRLDAVNPNYTLTNLRPAGFEPKVTGLDFTDDGRLVVTTSGSVSSGGWVPNAEPGEVFLLDNVLGDTSADQVVPTKVATDLLNPMGVDVIGAEIFVSERDQLTRLTDPDGDGFYDLHTKVAEWPDGGNFHEFAFGLVHDDENFYVNLSVAIDNGGATTNPQPAQNRGTAIKINRATGEVGYIAGGLRTPNGVVLSDTGELFATDNQGGWLPASKLVEVKQDRFFNHYTTPAGPFDQNPVTPPALWIPQNEIGNSPSAPAFIEQGAFAGQMLIGDVTYGGLQRAFLEKVDGEYQGAIFRHTAGLEAGVNRTIVGPDGAIYLGGIGEGGNWGESDKLHYGLQKLTPVAETAFDMKSVKVVEGGFAIEYTQPVSAETVAKIATAYRAQQWRYVPTPEYGGPKVDEETLVVSGATVSEDRTTVTLAIDGLKPGRVVHLRSPRPFASESGAELWNTEAWYTLNSLPGYVAPADRGWYEAEEATLAGGAKVDAEHNGYSGSGFAAGIQEVGSSVTFTANAAEAGTHPVNLRYANGPNPFDGTKTVSVYVNGQKVGPWELPKTGTWKTWTTATRNLDLVAGANTITIKFDAGDTGNVNLDALSVGASVDICAPGSVEEGYTALFDGTLASFDPWRLSGPGSFGRVTDDCSLRGSGGLGLLWHTGQEFESYSLKLDWKLVADHNGGVFVGFPDPGNDPFVAVNKGYEIQIDATDAPDRTTGSIYTFQGADPAAVTASLKPVGSWNSYDIRVEGQTITVLLNGTVVNEFTSTDPARDISQGFVGIQNHGAGEAVSYRDIRIKDLAKPLAVSATVDVRCVAGKALVAVRATNNDTVNADITIATSFGEKTLKAVKPGAALFHAFTTRLASLPAGKATVTATGDGRTAVVDAPWAAKNCG
jgi:hypothetical protein